MKTIVILPPLVQLNTPYPSGAYLSAFFKSQGHDCHWYDMSVELVNAIFCREGLKKLFSLTEKTALKKAEEFISSGDETSASILREYIYQEKTWIEWIDPIMEILRDGTNFSSRELCHRFVFSPFVPHGNRMNRYLENLDREPCIDDARNLACAAVEDLADYITFVYDKNFSLIRYAESIAINEKSFQQIEDSIESPLFNNFYKPIVESLVNNVKLSSKEKILVCISVPFAGTFIGALYTAKIFRQILNDNAYITFGGGFINTELRDCEDIRLSSYCNALSYDRGYGSYKIVLENITSDKFSATPAYKLRQFFSDKIIPQKEEDKELEEFENKITGNLVPDYSDIDFSKYARMADDTNPMQRIWSDGSWLKAYLAHGCYWHRCAFCDVTLDYVKSYQMTNIKNLFNGLYSQCMQKNIRGIHFVDEAMPPVAMVKFAKENIEKESPLAWWGNVRFEKTYSYQMAQILSAGGLMGVSGGIEIATGSGLDKISKGTDLESIVSACCAFKEAGILIHAYMIYGYYGETEQDTINSMETLRQLFATGLIDSCFWHKFVLTRHSRIYSEWLQGMHKDLVPSEDKSGIFAKNGMHFKGENRLAKFGEGLNNALQHWMHGEKLNSPLSQWFDFNVPKPTVPKNLVEQAVEKYEKRKAKESQQSVNIEKALWLGGTIIITKNKISWLFMQEEEFIKPNMDQQSIIEFTDALNILNQDNTKMKELIKKNPQTLSLLQSMKGRGLMEG